MACSFLTGENAAKASGWFAQRIPGCSRGWRDCVILVNHNGMDIRGGVVFHDYSPESETICLSAAGNPGWLTRTLIRLTHEYIFETCQMAVWQCAEGNRAINKLAEGLGYTPHRIPRLRGRDEAEVIWTLTDDEWNESPFKR